MHYSTKKKNSRAELAELEQCSGGQQKTHSSTRKSKKVPILEEDQEVLDRKSINHLGAENIE